MLSLFDGIATGEVLEEGALIASSLSESLGRRGWGRCIPIDGSREESRGWGWCPQAVLGALAALWALWSHCKALSPQIPGQGTWC